LYDVDDQANNTTEGNTELAGYIVGAAPTSSTIGDLWDVIWEQEVPYVVQLASGSDYLPNSSNPVAKHGTVTVQYQGEESLSNGDLVVTTVSLSSESGQGKRTLRHVSYKGWPENGVPSNITSFCELIHLLDGYVRDVATQGRESGQAREKELFPLVHCSAGLGRSGTFVLAHLQIALLAKRLKKSQKILFSLPEILRHMRRQRKGVVQRVDQYLFCYSVVAILAQSELKIAIDKSSEEDDQWTPPSTADEYSDDEDEETAGGEKVEFEPDQQAGNNNNNEQGQEEENNEQAPAEGGDEQ